MLRFEFDNHPLWALTATIRSQVEQVIGLGVAEDLPYMETVLFYVNYAESFRALAGTHMVLFSGPMLSQVIQPFTDTTNALSNRLAINVVQPFSPNAATAAEASLIPMAPWPRPYGRGGQVAQMETLFEDLLLRQSQSIAALDEEHRRLRATLAEYEAVAMASRDTALDELTRIQATAKGVEDTVTGEKTRVDEVVTNGIKSVAAIEAENTERYKNWRAAREESFTADFAGLKKSIETDLVEANLTLESLMKTNAQYENLAALAAGDVIASNYSEESKWGRRSGLVLYGLGGLFLLAASVPLIWLLFENPDTKDGTPDWGRIAVRLALGVLAGSGATVVIRLGARFINNANLNKRMELELRSFGPFLANVEDQRDVDKARIDLLDRSFGKHYAPDSKENEDVVPVSAFSQLVEVVARLTK